jgi:hypothetical protein
MRRRVASVPAGGQGGDRGLGAGAGHIPGDGLGHGLAGQGSGVEAWIRAMSRRRISGDV